MREYMNNTHYYGAKRQGFLPSSYSQDALHTLVNKLTPEGRNMMETMSGTKLMPATYLSRLVPEAPRSWQLREGPLPGSPGALRPASERFRKHLGWSAGVGSDAAYWRTHLGKQRAALRLARLHGLSRPQTLSLLGRHRVAHHASFGPLLSRMSRRSTT